MTPQDRSLKHHDIYRKRTWRKMKMYFFFFFYRWDRRGASGASVDTTGFRLYGPVAAVQVTWQSQQWDDDFTSCLRASVPSSPSSPTLLSKHACVNCSQYILHMCSRQSFVSCPRILPFTSFRETDLYFPAHWPGYYYKWEGNNIGWTAGSACNLLHICPFHGGLWTRDSVHRSLLARQQICLCIHPVVCLSENLNPISLASDILQDTFVPFVCCLVKCLLEVD